MRGCYTLVRTRGRGTWIEKRIWMGAGIMEDFVNYMMPGHQTCIKQKHIQYDAGHSVTR